VLYFDSTICFSCCKTCAIGLLKATYLLTYLLTYLHKASVPAVEHETTTVTLPRQNCGQYKPSSGPVDHQT